MSNPPPSMLIHRAHDGFSFEASTDIRSESLYDVFSHWSSIIDVPVDAIIAFSKDGEQVRETNWRSFVLGEEESKQNERREFYVFSKDLLRREPEEIIPSLSIRINEDIPAEASLFPIPSNLLPEVLISHLLTQSHCLNIATSNLSLHLQTLLTGFNSFLPLAKTQIDEYEGGLLRNFDVGKERCGGVTVLKGFLSEREQGTRTGENVERKKLKDFVSWSKMEIVRDGCEKRYEDHVTRLANVEQTIRDLEEETEHLRQGVEELKSTAAQSFSEAHDLASSLSEASNRATSLKSNHNLSLDDQNQLHDLEDLGWRSLEELVDIKNSYTAHLIHTLRQISHLQSTIATLPSILAGLKTELESKGAFAHLERLESMVISYGCVLVECIRRREFGEVLARFSSSASSKVASVLDAERTRRQSFMKALPPPPWGLKGLEDISSQLELKAISSQSIAGTVRVEREDVTALLSVLKAMSDSEKATDADVSGEMEKIFKKVEESFGKLEDEMDALKISLAVLETEPEDENDEVKKSALLSEIDRLRAELSVATKDTEAAQQQATTVKSKLSQVQDQLTETQSQLEKAKASGDREIASLTAERIGHLREIGQAHMQVQDLVSQVRSSRNAFDSVNRLLSDTKEQHEKALKAQVTEADLRLRNHIAETDGDRAILEHQLSQAKETVDQAKADTESITKKSIREFDTLKAELKMIKVQLKDAQSQKTKVSEELAREKIESKIKEDDYKLMVDQVLQIASDFKETDVLLHSTILANNSSSSRGVTETSPSSRPSRSQTASVPLEISRIAEKDVASTIADLKDFDRDAFAEAVNKTVGLVKNWKRQCKDYRDKARDKIAFRNFTKGDLALFLPTRNATAKPWAAFNISFPHYFLRAKDEMAAQLAHREWMVARIVSIEEAVVDPRRPETNPFGLDPGVKYFLLDAEPYTPVTKHSSRRTHSSTGAAHNTGERFSRDEMEFTASPSKSPIQASLISAPTVSQTELDVTPAPDDPTLIPFTPSAPTQQQSTNDYFFTSRPIDSPPFQSPQQSALTQSLAIAAATSPSPFYTDQKEETVTASALLTSTSVPKYPTLSNTSEPGPSSSRQHPPAPIATIPEATPSSPTSRGTSSGHPPISIAGVPSSSRRPPSIASSSSSVPGSNLFGPFALGSSPGSNKAIPTIGVSKEGIETFEPVIRRGGGNAADHLLASTASIDQSSTFARSNIITGGHPRHHVSTELSSSPLRFSPLSNFVTKIGTSLSKSESRPDSLAGSFSSKSEDVLRKFN